MRPQTKKKTEPKPRRKVSQAHPKSYGHILRHIEKEAGKGRSFFRTLFEQSTHGICITDLDRTVIMINQEVENLTGYSEKDLIGKPITNIYPKNDGVKMDIDALKREELVSVSLRLKKKRRGGVPVRIRYVLLRNLIGHDVIMETYSDLSDRLRIDQLKNEFVFVAAHELRNPVTAIKLLLDIIFDDKRVVLDSILRNYLLKIQEANERLTHLVDDLLEVSRTESNRLKIHVTKQNMTKQINQILNDMRPTAVSKGLSLNYSPAEKVPTVMADSMKLKEILSNLISNAIKYNVTSGTVRISHKIKSGFLFTSISDSGIGITTKDQKNLFEKFWRSEDLAVRAQAGTGLGLFIVRELIHRMGGDIKVKSKHGQGTTFTFSLPLA